MKRELVEEVSTGRFTEVQAGRAYNLLKMQPSERAHEKADVGVQIGGLREVSSSETECLPTRCEWGSWEQLK